MEGLESSMVTIPTSTNLETNGVLSTAKIPFEELTEYLMKCRPQLLDSTIIFFVVHIVIKSDRS